MLSILSRYGRKVDDGHQAQAAAAAVRTTGPVGDTERLRVRHAAGGDDVAVVIVAADALVEIDKLRRSDLARVERAKTILNADFVFGAAGAPGPRARPKSTDHVVVGVAAGAALVCRRVIDQRHRN